MLWWPPLSHFQEKGIFSWHFLGFHIYFKITIVSLTQKNQRSPSPTTNQHKKPPNDHVTPKALQPSHPPIRTQNHLQQHPHHRKRQHHQQSSQHNTLTITITGGTSVLGIAYDTYAPTNTGYNAHITQANIIKHTIASITPPSASPPATSATTGHQSHHNR